MNSLAQVLGQLGPNLKLVVVQIVSVQTGTLTAHVGGDPFAGVAYLAHVNPQPGQKAVALVSGTQYTVIGITAQ